jgi:hypothetical protein
MIVIVTEEGEDIRRITLNMEKHVRFASGSSEDGSAEDTRDRQFTNRLGGYYDKIISCIRDAESILIFGPGEAKGEIERRLEREELGGRIVGIETVDKMTDRQIAAKVRQHFLANTRPSGAS